MFKTPGTHGKALWLTAAAPAPAQSNPMFNMEREHVLPNVTQVTRFPGPIPGGRSFADWTFVTKSLFIWYATNFASPIESSREPLFSFNDQHATQHTHTGGALDAVNYDEMVIHLLGIEFLLFLFFSFLLMVFFYSPTAIIWRTTIEHPPSTTHPTTTTTTTYWSISGGALCVKWIGECSIVASETWHAFKESKKKKRRSATLKK